MMFPYIEEHGPELRKFIDSQDMECKTLTFPEFGVVAFDTISHDCNDWYVIGYIGAHRKYGKKGHIDMFVVKENRRGNKVGPQMARMLFDTLSRAGMDSFTAHTEMDNDRAREFYESLGMEAEPIYRISGSLPKTMIAIDKYLDEDKD